MDTKDKKIFLITSVLFIATLLLVLGINIFIRNDALRPAIEGLLFFGIMTILIKNDHFRSYVKRLPRIHLAFIVIFFFSCLVAQYIDREKTTFPFVGWDMFAYGQDHETQVFNFIIVGVDEHGEENEISPPRLFPSLAHNRINGGIIRRLFAHLAVNGHPLIKEEQSPERAPPKSKRISRKWSHWAKKSLPRVYYGMNKLFSKDYPLDDIEEVDQDLEDYLTAVGNMYNRLNPDKEIKRIDIKFCVRNVNDPEDIDGTCQVNWQYQISQKENHEAAS